MFWLIMLIKMKNLLLVSVIILLSVSCTDVRDSRRIPKKPFYIISVEGHNSDYRVFYIDADSTQFYFDLDWLDHGKYKPGDIIK